MFVKVLPPEVRSKIAAGEVIESPADVVKELVENSLDAKATQIEVEISKGGKRFILVRDNGTGIHPEDFSKVILEGATSKIESEKDLLNLSSYGFRGEALHSIASVSRMILKSRYFQENFGLKMLVEGGEIKGVEKVGMPVGTEVEVKDLFFNLPARRKFLKREDTERNRITELLKEYALVNPNVGFSLYSNAREILLLKPSDLRTRVESLFEEKFEVFEEEKEFLKVKVFLRRNVKQGKYYVFINSRPIASRNIKEFLKKVLGYKTLGVIFIELPPFLIDFNVHPKKREVRFVKERKVLSLLKEALSSKEYALPDYLSQDVPKYEDSFRVIGQINDTIILAQRGDYLYFFDQHLISERHNYEKLKDRPDADQIACKSALKAGEPLSEEDMKRLIEVWKNLENPHVCPHGRPIYWRIHLKDIYEKLGRSY